MNDPQMQQASYRTPWRWAWGPFSITKTIQYGPQGFVGTAYAFYVEAGRYSMQLSFRRYDPL